MKVEQKRDMLSSLQGLSKRDMKVEQKRDMLSFLQGLSKRDMKVEQKETCRLLFRLHFLKHEDRTKKRHVVFSSRFVKKRHEG
jgi:hypothetical protein